MFVFVFTFTILKAFSISLRCCSVNTNVVIPSCPTAFTLFVTSVATGLSVKSKSTNVILPLSLNFIPSVIIPLTSTIWIVGASFVPVIVTEKLAVVTKPSASLTFIGIIIVSVSPSPI